MKIQQLVVGISLLVIAFFLGRMMNQSKVDESPSGDDTVVQTDDQNSAATTDIPNAVANEQGPSLLDRLKRRGGHRPGERATNESPFRLPSGDSSIVRDRNPSPPSQNDNLHPIDEIVTPDFSPLQLSGPESSGSEPAVLEPDQVVDVELKGSPSQGIVVGPIASSEAETPNGSHPSHVYETGPTATQARDGSASSALPRTAMRRVPFGLNTRAKSQLSKVHRRDHQVLLTTQQFQNHTVQAGETLQSLSTLYYGRPDYYLDIYLANQELMANPSDMPVGKSIRIPLFSKQ